MTLCIDLEEKVLKIDRSTVQHVQSTRRGQHTQYREEILLKIFLKNQDIKVHMKKLLLMDYNIIFYKWRINTGVVIRRINTGVLNGVLWYCSRI